MTRSPVSKSIIWRIFIWAAMILLVLILCRTGAALVHNYRLQSGFTAATPPSPYQQGIPMDEMDLSAYSSLWPNVFAAVGYDWTNRVATPVAIRYYTGIPGHGAATDPALEIPKGTMILVLTKDWNGPPAYEVGYGYTGYPTYEKGWRYVRPFLAADGERLPSAERYYYVRIEELKAVIGEVIEANQTLRDTARQMRFRFQSPEHRMATHLDQILYRNGVYLSPDLYRHVFDRWNVLLTAAAVVLILPPMIARRAGFRADGKP